MLLGMLIGVIALYTIRIGSQKADMITHAYTIPQIAALFNWSPEKITAHTERVIAELRSHIDTLIATDRADFSYVTIAGRLDRICTISDYAIAHSTISALEMLSPDKAIRDAAHAAIVELQNVYVDVISSNKKLYRVLKQYADEVAPNENLSEKQHYFITQTIRDFERAGLQLPDKELAALAELKKEIAQLCTEFSRAIAQDNSIVTLPAEELVGVSEAARTAFNHDDAGNYVLRLDYPTVDTVLQNCTVESTRKKIYRAFVNRAYPANDLTLRNLLEKRQELAEKLGFACYSEYDLADEMVATPERANAFLLDIAQHAKTKEAEELAELTQELPESVTRTTEGKIKPWDVAFTKERYKQKHYQLNQEEIAQYFPVEKTITGLFAIYEAFFSIKLTEVSTDTLFWHPDVRIMQLRNSNNHLLGTILLDLFPRENKYSHACHMTIIPAHITAQSVLHPGVSIVVANFPKPTPDKPALLKLNDVKTFFHEFGHALHAILGATEIISLSGTNTKRDFVELPSQILEEWLGDGEILRMISSHYATENPLPDHLIERIITLKHFDSGSFVQRQIVLSFMSLNYYSTLHTQDLYQIAKHLHEQFRPGIAFDPEDHMYASFGHLPSYAAKYYGYLWSRVFALDIFAHIKKEGLLNPLAGKRYRESILAFGGTKDPNELLCNYLGRQPSTEAFLLEMGFVKENDSLKQMNHANNSQKMLF